MYNFAYPKKIHNIKGEEKNREARSSTDKPPDQLEDSSG